MFFLEIVILDLLENSIFGVDGKEGVENRFLKRFFFFNKLYLKLVLGMNGVKVRS